MAESQKANNDLFLKEIEGLKGLQVLSGTLQYNINTTLQNAKEEFETGLKQILEKNDKFKIDFGSPSSHFPSNSSNREPLSPVSFHPSKRAYGQVTKVAGEEKWRCFDGTIYESPHHAYRHLRTLKLQNKLHPEENQSSSKNLIETENEDEKSVNQVDDKKSQNEGQEKSTNPRSNAPPNPLLNFPLCTRLFGIVQSQHTGIDFSFLKTIPSLYLLLSIWVNFPIADPSLFEQKEFLLIKDNWGQSTPITPPKSSQDIQINSTQDNNLLEEHLKRWKKNKRQKIL